MKITFYSKPRIIYMKSYFWGFFY